MIEKGLPSKLWLLSKSIAEKVMEYKNSGNIVKLKKLYVKPKFEQFKYKEGFASYRKSFEYVEKEEWNERDQFNFIETVIKQFPGYHEIVSEISKKYRVNEAQADYWLSRFVQIVIQKIQEGITDEVLVGCIATFNADLERAPIEWRPKIWIEGVWLKNEECEIYDWLKIRRPKPSDLEVERPFDMLPFQTTSPTFKEFTSAILEITYRSRNPGETQEEIFKIIKCLRLFRVGSVFYVKYRMRPQSFLAFGGTHSSVRILLFITNTPSAKKMFQN